ncbi:MAG: hypothetical protein L0216_02630 [Planctomycetales bacterium]|nr:hypothetical protein [Planctomycetales bacterium]
MNGNGATLATRPAPLGLLGVLATVGMLFAAFTAAYLVRRTAADWRPVALPAIAWANVAVLVSSGAAVEAARRTGRGPWLLAGLGLGVAFLGGQLLAWRDLAGRGVFLATGPHGSFLYVLSAVHGAHVLAGLGALAYAGARPAALGTASAFWHFVGGIWLYVLVVVSVL